MQTAFQIMRMKWARKPTHLAAVNNHGRDPKDRRGMPACARSDRGRQAVRGNSSAAGSSPLAMRWPAQRVIACGMRMHADEDIQHPVGQTAAAASEAARLRKPKKGRCARLKVVPSPAYMRFYT